MQVPRYQIQRVHGNSCNFPVTVDATHVTGTPHTISMCFRAFAAEDPWITVYGHTSQAESDTHSGLYGEAYTGAWCMWVDNRQGVNIYVR
jgi:hypothetical protein